MAGRVRDDRPAYADFVAAIGLKAIESKQNRKEMSHVGTNNQWFA